MTKLIYLEDFNLLNCEAKVTDTFDVENLCNRFIDEGRVVLFGDFGVPCGGTHVSNISEIKNMTIRKIKNDGGNIRVGYDVAR